MNVEKIDHIHIKVQHLENAVKTYEEVLGIHMPDEIDCSSEYGMKVAFHPFPQGIELMEVTDVQKKMGAIYEKAPEGVFAISLKVADIDAAGEEMEKMGYHQLMRYEFGEIKEALFDTADEMKVYTELVEYKAQNIENAEYTTDAFEIKSGR